MSTLSISFVMKKIAAKNVKLSVYFVRKIRPMFINTLLGLASLYSINLHAENETNVANNENTAPSEQTFIIRTELYIDQIKESAKVTFSNGAECNLEIDLENKTSTCKITLPTSDIHYSIEGYLERKREDPKFWQASTERLFADPATDKYQTLHNIALHFKNYSVHAFVTVN